MLNGLLKQISYKFSVAKQKLDLQNAKFTKLFRLVSLSLVLLNTYLQCWLHKVCIYIVVELDDGNNSQKTLTLTSQLFAQFGIAGIMQLPDLKIFLTFF